MAYCCFNLPLITYGIGHFYMLIGHMYALLVTFIYFAQFSFREAFNVSVSVIYIIRTLIS